MKIDGIEYVPYNESDLRFTGWEHECIIIDRSSNRYLIPKNRYEEIESINNKISNVIGSDPRGISGCSGISGTVGKKLS